LLSFGALIGSVIADALVALDLLDGQYFMLLVVVGMASFFAASVRTPLTAMAFAIEALSGFGNVLPIFLGVIIAYVIVEAVGANSINEIAMEREIHHENAGKTLHVLDLTVEAMPGSFAIGKEPRDILWPPSCKLLSVKQENAVRHFYTGGHIRENDVLHLNLTTYDLDVTAQQLCALLGDQEIFDDGVIHHEKYENTIPKH